jgi:hypothetical protein
MGDISARMLKERVDRVFPDFVLPLLLLSFLGFTLIEFSSSSALPVPQLSLVMNFLYLYPFLGKA